MREIKFRAWDKENKRMLPVDYMKLDFGKVPYVNGETFSKDDGWFDYELWYDEFELMQYTGIKDFDGKEIYEGDILTGGSYTSCEIFFLDGGFSCDRLNPFCFYQAIVKDEKLKVIGNIYENPELLNENT